MIKKKNGQKKSTTRFHKLETRGETNFYETKNSVKCYETCCDHCTRLCILNRQIVLNVHHLNEHALRDTSRRYNWASTLYCEKRQWGKWLEIVVKRCSVKCQSVFKHVYLGGCVFMWVGCVFFVRNNSSVAGPLLSCPRIFFFASLLGARL